MTEEQQNSALRDLRLGRQQAYVAEYDAGLLQTVPRALSREALRPEPFYGLDLWTGYELSWLDGNGKPQVAIAEFSVPSHSPNLIESKSFKYYLNSLNQTRFDSVQAVQEVLQRDLSAAAGESSVTVTLYSLSAFAQQRARAQDLGQCIDDLPLGLVSDQPDVSVLQQGPRSDGVWLSHLFKSNCPVTGQPDWASIWIGHRGLQLDPASLLTYLISYRQHDDFHENCVERIFTDLSRFAQPEDLWVYARYTRRGGLDINPFRSASAGQLPPKVVGVRQ